MMTWFSVRGDNNSGLRLVVGLEFKVSWGAQLGRPEDDRGVVGLAMWGVEIT